MKNALGILLVILLGLALGFGVARLRVGTVQWDVAADRAEQPPPPPPRGPTPKVEIDQPAFDFGEMDIAAEGRHEFVIRNVGDGPLKLIAGGTSCRCTMSELAHDEVPPGGQSKITLTWHATEQIGPYQQTAKIMTNDPAMPQVELTVKGRITAAAQFMPAQLVFSRLTADEKSVAHAQLLSYLAEPLVIAGHEFSDPATAKFFEVSHKPLSADELKQWPEARSGELITVGVLPGLPQGAVHQRIVSRLGGKSPAEIALPVSGIVGGEISIAGPGWDADTGILKLGAISSRAGAKRRLMLVVRGPLRQEISFKPIETVPGSLRVALGERRELSNGAVMQTPLEIEGPPGSPPCVYLGKDPEKLGRVVLETTHPDMPKLRILVQMAIEE